MKRFILFFFNLSFLVNAQEVITHVAIQDSIYSQLALFPQEKIHLHTDRSMYVPGEKIWFKAYIVDAMSHLSPTYSQYVYVELIDASDSLVTRVMAYSDKNGLFHGNIFLSQLIPEGDYTIRAYTRYMENLGDDYFFKKPIHIGSFSAASKQAKRQPRSNYDVSFFPEGGDLTEGVQCRVAFKALNQQGASEAITGEIVDNKGNSITDVSTVFAGMGSFVMTPEVGATYFLVAKNSSGQEKRFKLPPAKKTCTIVASYRNKRHYIQVKKTPGLPDKALYILVHCKGEILYFNVWNPQRDFLTFSSDQLPSGVIQVVLFDDQMNPVSERLIFNKNEDQAQLAFSSDKPFYQKREKVQTEIYVTDVKGIPLTGHVSVAITDDKDIAVDTHHTIAASLLLSSELRGYIESPGYYLQDHTHAEYALDHLMMTHGWRRYDIPEAIKGNYRHPTTTFEVSKEISGSVKGIILGRAVVNGEVLLFSTDGSFGQAVTDSAGMFLFYYHYPDSARFFVQAKNQKGKPGVELILNHEKFPVLKHLPVGISLLSNSIAQENHADNFIKKAEQRAQYDEDMKLVQLKEVTVTARKIEKKDEVRLKYWANASSDKTIYREEIEKRNVQYVSHLLYSIAGVCVENGMITIRGSSGPPLVLIDGIPMEWPEIITSLFDSPLEIVSVHDIESIDVFKGPNAAVFGSRGANGAISITTRRGDSSYRPRNFSANYATYSPIGYQKPVEFYAPKYDTPELKNLSIPDYRTTIFWKPDLLVSEDGRALFDFYTSDFPTTYSIVIEGISKDGKIIRKIETIEVQ